MKTPFRQRDLVLFLMENEKALKEGPHQLCMGVNWFVAHERAPIDGFQVTGDPITFVMDDLSGRKETFRILIKDDFEPKKKSK